MLRRCVLAAVVVLGFVGRGSAQEVKPANIDLVICLDVSSSMNGLINSAKSKLWGIVNELAKTSPTPNLRVALYSYGHSTYDRNTGWVKQDLDFTQDLDKVNDKLFGLRTGGGEELVARVCKASLEQLKWSADPKALKIIFVCGNESAHQDKENTLKSVAESAVKQGVVINSIFCGNETTGTKLGWRDFALLAEGRYAAIDQNSPAVAIATPVDKQIAELGAKLNDTYVFVGAQRKALEGNQAKQDANAAQLGGGVAAERAVTKANGIYRFQEDLVERVQKKEAVDLAKVPDADLPECLKKVPAADREAHLKNLADQRTKLQTQILDLNRQREAFIRDAQAKQPAAPTGFDAALRGAIRDQAKAKGIQLDSK